jgi:hypothetical protein
MTARLMFERLLKRPNVAWSRVWTGKGDTAGASVGGSKHTYPSGIRSTFSP